MAGALWVGEEVGTGNETQAEPGSRASQPLQAAEGAWVFCCDVERLLLPQPTGPGISKPAVHLTLCLHTPPFLLWIKETNMLVLCLGSLVPPAAAASPQL